MSDSLTTPENAPRDQARALLGRRSLVFHMNQGQASRFEPEVFKQFVELAVDFGATHINVGLLPFRYGSWMMPDNTDPYACWCVTSPSLLRMCPPPELQPWVSLQDAEEMQDVIQARLEMMRPYGLKGVVFGVEPLFLPLDVFRAHPRWMGAQCELGRIAEKPYYTPSIDDPEVLDLYRRATRRFVELFPEIDELDFMSNDSGAGLSWAPCIYPGMNGPIKYRRRDAGERLAGFIDAMQSGAKDAGVDVRINLHSSGLPPEWVASSRVKLKSGQFVQGGNVLGERMSGASAGLSGGLWSLAYPAVGLDNPAGFINGLSSVYQNPKDDDDRARISFNENDMDLARTAMEVVVDNPGTGMPHNLQLSLELATRLCGTADHAEALIGIWERVKTAQHAIGQIRQKGFGHVLPFAGVSMRWIIRPLVPQPELLTFEEKAYYRDFLLATEQDKDNPSFGMVLGKMTFRGESVMWMARWCLFEAITTLQGARASAQAIADKLDDPDARARISLYAARIGALACLATNAKNCIMFQYALDIAEQPQFGPNAMDYDDNIIYDHRAVNMRKIAREEFDNTVELIDILESQPGVVLEWAHQPEEESVFMLSPHVIDDLKRKLNIMLDHWQDYERLYPSTKVFDFEPEPVGNIV